MVRWHSRSLATLCSSLSFSQTGHFLVHPASTHTVRLLSCAGAADRQVSARAGGGQSAGRLLSFVQALPTHTLPVHLFHPFSPHTLRLFMFTAQVLLTAKSQLEQVVDKQLDDAVARRDAAAVLRFARLYKPLGKQVRQGCMVV